MKKYLFIILLVGVSFGQVVPDTLIMKGGRVYIGTYLDKNEYETKFRFQKTTEISKIRNLQIERMSLGSGKILINSNSGNFKTQSVNGHMLKTGKHLKSFFEKSMFSLGLSLVGTYLGIKAEEEKDLLLPFAIHFGAFYNSILAMIEVNKAGNELIKASKSMKGIERDLSSN